METNVKGTLLCTQAAARWMTDERECGLSLSEGDAFLLDRLTAMRPGFCQRVVGGIKLAQYCGIVRLKTCVLEVLPKIGNADTSSQVKAARSRAALLNMLRRSPDITITEAGRLSECSSRISLRCVHCFIS
jgi:5-methylcytosine-specific restriction enzyme subunit McrC